MTALKIYPGPHSKGIFVNLVDREEEYQVRFSFAFSDTSRPRILSASTFIRFRRSPIPLLFSPEYYAPRHTSRSRNRPTLHVRRREKRRYGVSSLTRKRSVLPSFSPLATISSLSKLVIDANSHGCSNPSSCSRE